MLRWQQKKTPDKRLYGRIDMVCEICGKHYRWMDHNSHFVCSKECGKLRKNKKQREYWDKNKERLSEARKIYPKEPERVKDTLAEINEMARERHLTYGQMQGVFYCQEHPIR